MTPTTTLSVADSLIFGAAAVLVSSFVHPIEHVDSMVDLMSKSLELFTRVGGAGLVVAGWWRVHHPKPVKRGRRRKRGPHVVIRVLRALRNEA